MEAEIMEYVPSTDLKPRVSSDIPIDDLIVALESRDVLVRHHAGHVLALRSREALRQLLAALRHPSAQVRCEAARALRMNNDPLVVPALVAALNDESFAVRWVAAESLIAQGRAGIIAVLRALRDAAWDDLWVREGAHHILRAGMDSSTGKALAPVLAALEGMLPELEAPQAAHRALGMLLDRR